MATDDTTHRMLEELRIRPKKDGSAYIVDRTIDGQRHQAEFRELTLAIAYAQHVDARVSAGQTPLSGPDFKKAVRSGTKPEDLTATRTLALEVLDRYEQINPDARQQVNILRTFFASQPENLLADDVTMETARLLPIWLQDERFSRAEARKVLKTVEDAWDVAVGSGDAIYNRWIGLKAKKSESELDRRMRPRIRGKARAFSASDLLAIAHLLRPCYLLAFWIIALLGLRRSEAMGLLLGDWTCSERRLSITGQRKASGRKGRTRPKTRAGLRSLVVPHALAAAIDRYIADHHGAAPSDPVALSEWNARYLLVGAMGGPMDSASFMKALKCAYGELGLVPELIGRFRPIHHLRKSLGGRLQSSKKGLSGPAIAELLGHEHPSRNDNDVPDVTVKHYNPLTAGSLGRLYEHLDTWTYKKIVSKIESGDLLQLNELADPISVSEAVRLVQRVRTEATRVDIRQLIVAGVLPVRKMKHGNQHQIVLLDRKVLEELIAATVREESESYTAGEVSDLLAVDRDVLPQLEQRSVIDRLDADPRDRRRSTRGAGALPGGGYRYSKTQIDQLVEAHAEDIRRRRGWLTSGQTAALLGVSSDSVRRKFGEHEWRDSWSVNRRRFYDPKNVEDLRREIEEITVGGAAQELSTTQNHVRGLVKLGVIRTGRNRGWVRAIDVRRLVEERGHCGGEQGSAA